MSRRTPLRVCTLRTTTSANSFAMMIGPSFPPSVGYSAGSCTSGRSARGPCGSAAMSSPPDESTGWSEEYGQVVGVEDRKSTRLNSSHVKISYAVFCLKKKNTLTLNIQLKAIQIVEVTIKATTE